MDRAEDQPNAFSVQTRSGIACLNHEYFLRAVAYVKLPDGRVKSFTEREPMPPEAAARLGQKRNAHNLNYYSDLRKEEDHHEVRLHELEIAVRERAQAWFDTHAVIPARLPRIFSFVSGIGPARLVPLLQPYKFIWVRSDDRAVMASELMAAFRDFGSASPTASGEKLIKIIQEPDSQSALYVKVTPEEWDKIRRIIIGIQQKRLRRAMQ